MKDQIERLENQVKELKLAYENDQKARYESMQHKHFDVGNLVTDGEQIGVVGWTENKACDCPYESGYMGVSLINGNRGFLAFAKRDEWEVCEDSYYAETHKLEIKLTGFEIEEIKYSLGGRNVNPNKAKTKILDALDLLRE